MKLYFVRHAEVMKAYQGCYNGHIDIPLSPKGKQNAKELAKKLSHIKFDRAFCSDLLRARETIEAFDLECEVVYTNRLREKSWGKHEGMNFEEITKEGLEYKSFKQWIAALDGEPIERYAMRLQEYFKEVLLKQKGKNILIVTHAGVIKILIYLTKRMDLNDAFSIALPYSGYIIYDTKRNGFVLS